MILRGSTKKYIYAYLYFVQSVDDLERYFESAQPMTLKSLMNADISLAIVVQDVNNYLLSFWNHR